MNKIWYLSDSMIANKKQQALGSSAKLQQQFQSKHHDTGRNHEACNEQGRIHRPCDDNPHGKLLKKF